jgi:hypothetical protein
VGSNPTLAADETTCAVAVCLVWIGWDARGVCERKRT